MSSHMRRISPYQANCGIYLDFEGFKNKPPSIAGMLVEEKIWQVVLDPALESAAQAKGLAVMTFEALIKLLLADCEQNDRFIIAFSNHEREVVQRDLGIDITSRFKNAKYVASQWRKSFHPDIEWDGNSLANFLQLPGIDYKVPAHLGKGNATSRLNAVLNGLSKRGDYASLTAVQKAKWTKLLDYNKHDVLGLRHLTIITSTDLKRGKRKSD